MATAGCNSGSTKVTGADEYEVDGQAITFGLGKVTFEIDRNTMTLENADGIGLLLRK